MRKLRFLNATYNSLTNLSMEKNRCFYFFNFLTYMKFKLTLGIPLDNDDDWWRHQLDHMIKVMTSSVTCFVKGYSSSFNFTHRNWDSAGRFTPPFTNHVCKKSSTYEGLNDTDSFRESLDTLIFEVTKLLAIPWSWEKILQKKIKR